MGMTIVVALKFGQSSSSSTCSVGTVKNGVAVPLAADLVLVLDVVVDTTARFVVLGLAEAESDAAPCVCAFLEEHR